MLYCWCGLRVPLKRVYGSQGLITRAEKTWCMVYTALPSAPFLIICCSKREHL
uniref:Uncharacterized protein n=1 Tax=Anopheles stephensi TaxID=30069 RepID=A0A182Y893_ANOST